MYTGGELRISDKCYELNNDQNAVAFYSDLVHEVLPVKSFPFEDLDPNSADYEVEAREASCRVTATFYIMRREKTHKSDVPSSLSIERLRNPRYLRFLERLNESLKIEQALGFIARHEYAVHEILSCTLRGSDLTLYENLKDHYQITLLPILINHYEQDKRVFDEGVECTETVYRLSPEDITNYVLGRPLSVNRYKNLKFIRGVPQKSVELDHDEQGSIEYVGNEAQEGFFDARYWSVALIASTGGT